MKTATSPANRLAIGAFKPRSAKPLATLLASAALSLGLGSALISIASAQDSPRTIATGSNIPLAADAPDKYTVKKGDTLWDIAKVFLRDPWYWPEIWYVNPQVKNPHLIYPGDVLSLVSKDGIPQVMLTERGPDGAAAAAVEPTETTDLRRGSGTRLSPRVRSTPITEAVTAVPYDAIAAFLGKPSMLTTQQAKSGPYVVGFRDFHVMAAEGSDLYARGIRNAAVGTRYNIIHVEAPVRDPENNKVLGYRAMFAGVGTVAAGGDPAKLRAQTPQREILAGDRLVPEDVSVNLDFMPHPVPENLRGSIAAVDGVFIAGRYQVVAINRGTKQAVQVGHVFAIQQKGERIVDHYKKGTSDSSSTLGKRVKLPNERIGLVMVFKTYDRMSYGLIMEATHPVRIGDPVTAP